MKTKDVHVLNWEKFTLYTSKTNSSKNSGSNSTDKGTNRGIIFEDLIEALLAAMFPNEVWRRTKESHDGKKDFVYPDDEHLPDQKWAECKNYSSNLSLNVIAPTLIMGTIENIDSIFFFSYSPLNDNAIEGLLRYSEVTKKDVKVYDGNLLESLICKYHNKDNIAKFFPDTDFEKAYELLNKKKFRIITMVKDINGNKISPQHLFELGESFYIDLIIQNLAHTRTDYKIFIQDNEEHLLTYEMLTQYYSLPFAGIGEYSVFFQTLKPGNVNCILKVSSLDTKKTSTIKRKVKILDEPFLFWTGTNALKILEQCKQHLMVFEDMPLLITAGSGMGKSTLINILTTDIVTQSKYTVLKINLDLTRNCCIRNILSLIIGLHEGNTFPKDQVEEENKAFSFLIGNYAESAEQISKIIMRLYDNSHPFLFVIDDIQKIDRAYVELFNELQIKAQQDNKPLYFIFALNNDKCSLDQLMYRLNLDLYEQGHNFDIIKLKKFEKDDILAFLKHKFGLSDIEKYFMEFSRTIRPLDMHNFCTNIKRKRIIAQVPDSRVYQVIDPFKFEDSIQQIQYSGIPIKDICQLMDLGDIPEYILKYLYITDRISLQMRIKYKEIINVFITVGVLKENADTIEFYHEEIRKNIRKNFIFSEEDYADIYSDNGTDDVSKALCALNQLGNLREDVSYLKVFFRSNREIKKKNRRFEICWLIFQNLNAITQYSLTKDALIFVRQNYILLNSEQGHSTFLVFLKHIADAALTKKWDTDEESVEIMAYFIKKFFDRSLSTYNYQHCLHYFNEYKKIFVNIRHISDSRRYFWLSHYANRVAISLDRYTVPLSEEPEEITEMYALSKEYCKNADSNPELLLQIAVDDFNRHYIYRHDLTITTILSFRDELLDIRQNISEKNMILEYHLLLVEYLALKLKNHKDTDTEYKQLRKKVSLTRKKCISAFYILKLYILEIYINIDLENLSEAGALLSEAFEFAFKKEMRSYIYKLTYIKAHICIFTEKSQKSSESYRLIELAFEQLVKLRNNAIKDLKREIFLLVRLVHFIRAYNPDHILVLKQTLNADMARLIDEICDSTSGGLFDMKSYYIFKDISFPAI